MFFSLPVNWVKIDGQRARSVEHPCIVLLYPVQNELEWKMRTTFGALARFAYPRDRFEVVAILNADDASTNASLRRMQADFPFPQILEIPPATDASWQTVWDQ